MKIKTKNCEEENKQRKCSSPGIGFSMSRMHHPGSVLFPLFHYCKRAYKRITAEKQLQEHNREEKMK
jgi:hypothetical protein